MQQITYITVDVGRVDSLPPIVPAKQGDTGRIVQATITDKGVPFALGGAIAVARIRKPDNTVCVYDEGISVSGNVITIPLVAQALTAAGRARGEISLYTSSADRITTFDFWVEIEKNAVSDAEIVSSDYYNILTAQIAQILSSNTIVKPLGYYATLTALEAGVPSPNPGDMYAVGTAAPYNYYVWDGVGQQWVNNGPLEGAPGADGTPGATFTPIVYSDGVLAWTNDAGLDNPEPVNITGPVGPPGTGLNILGYYATLEALMTDVTAPAAGNTYGVGLAAPYDIYVWDGVGQRWVNNGQIEGLPGADGATFTPYVAADGTLSWTNDGGLENPAPVNIKGADGVDGATGPTGPAGPNRITAETETDLNGVLVGVDGNAGSVDVLPVSMGGTGASDAAEALTNLGGLQMVELWYNASPSSAFANQTISVDLSGYQFVAIVVGYNTNLSSGSQVCINYINTGTTTNMVCLCDFVTSSGNHIAPYRKAQIAGNRQGIVFSAGYMIDETTGEKTEDNQRAIPRVIYGIRGAI